MSHPENILPLLNCKLLAVNTKRKVLRATLLFLELILELSKITYHKLTSNKSQTQARFKPKRPKAYNTKLNSIHQQVTTTKKKI